jgi:hypothetical protein
MPVPAFFETTAKMDNKWRIVNATIRVRLGLLAQVAQSRYGMQRLQLNFAQSNDTNANLQQIHGPCSKEAPEATNQVQ